MTVKIKRNDIQQAEQVGSIDAELLEGNNNIGSVDIANLDTTGSMPTRPAGVSNFAINVITIDSDTTPVELKAGAEILNDRREIQIYPPDAGIIYIGESDVTTSTGLPLASDDPIMTIHLNSNETKRLYAINDGTNRDIRVVEIA